MTVQYTTTDEELSYSDLKDKIREEVSTKLPTKERLMLLAKKLEDDLVPKENICTDICKDLADIISDRYIRKLLPDEFKQKKKASGTSSANDDKKTIEENNIPEPEEIEILTDGAPARKQVDPDFGKGVIEEHPEYHIQQDATTLLKERLESTEKKLKEAFELLQDKDKHIDEMVREMKALQAANPENQKNPEAKEVVKSLQRKIEDLLKENEELKQLVKPEFTSAKDLQQSTTTFIQEFKDESDKFANILDIRKVQPGGRIEYVVENGKVVKRIVHQFETSIQ